MKVAGLTLRSNRQTSEYRFPDCLASDLNGVDMFDSERL